MNNLKYLEKTIEEMILDNYSYTEIYNMLNFFNVSRFKFKQFCYKSNDIRNAQKKLLAQKSKNIISLLEKKTHIHDIKKMSNSALGDIYKISNNYNLSLSTKKYTKTSMIIQDTQDTLYEFNPNNYPKDFTTRYKNTDNSLNIPHANQCNFIMSTSNKIDYYCHNHAVEILTKKNYCLDCYFKVHVVSDKQKAQIIKHHKDK